MKFADISKSEQLIEFLDDRSRMKDCEYLSHYTTFDKLIKILNSRLLFLGKADTMNDLLEFKKGNSDIWDRLYFTSLIMNRRENIGMWGIYSTPWEDGIKITIPKKVFIDWIDNCEQLYAIGKDMKPTGAIVKIDHMTKLYLSALAYTNIDSKESVKEKTITYWNTVDNKNLSKSEIEKPNMTGYIKDAAWMYEREMRVKALLPRPCADYCKLAISIEPIINDLIIFTGPLFAGSINQRLMGAVERYDEIKFNYECSIFTNNFHK